MAKLSLSRAVNPLAVAAILEAVFCVFAPQLFSAQTVEEEAVVIRATDGDSLVLDNGSSIHLRGVFCPFFEDTAANRTTAGEIGIAPEDFQLYAWRARLHIDDLCYNQTIRYRYDPEAPLTETGEISADVFRGEIFLNEKMVEEGFCLADKSADAPGQGRLLEIQDRAKVNKEGLWRYR